MRGSLVPVEFIPSYPSFVRELLWARGFRESNDAERFLGPSLSQVPTPVGQLLDLEIALELLVRARDQKQVVVIFGDYDVDGTTATTLLFRALRDWGFEVRWFIPHRLNEGYGVTPVSIDRLRSENPDVKLVITCDCGVASHEGVAKLEDSKIAVIVTDHHEPPSERVRAHAVLNPKQKSCPYPEKNLAGVGVAFLLLMALRRALDLRGYSLNSFLDLVAVGTVCDMAELKGANRALVKAGLDRLRNSEWTGLKVLVDSLGLSEKSRIRTSDLGFMIGPRLNAAGRVGNPAMGTRTLVCDSQSEAVSLISELEKLNDQRRSIQERQVEEALVIAAERRRRHPEDSALVIAEPHFHLGVVGLIASRLVQVFKIPVAVLTEIQDEHELAFYTGAVDHLWKGSLRAPPGYHLAQALQSLQTLDDVMIAGGGHAAAAGVTIRATQKERFCRSFIEAIGRQTVGAIPLTGEIDFYQTENLKESLHLLEPFGIGNPQPLLHIRQFTGKDLRVMKEVHFRWKGQIQTSKGLEWWSVLQFKSPYMDLMQKLASLEPKIDFLGELTENEWGGDVKLELILKDLLDVRVKGERVFIEKQGHQSNHQSIVENRV